MMMKSLISLFLSLLFVVSVVEGGLGTRKPIKVTDANVVLIAKFAISEHNKQSKANLVYEKIVQGTEQVVSGKKYDLIIAAKNGRGGATKNYEAIVLQKLWAHPSMILESFKEV